MVDLLVPYHLLPGLQRLAAIVAQRAERKRAEAGGPSTVVQAERVSAVNEVLPTPEGGVLVRLATVQGYPLQFTMAGGLAADLAGLLAQATPPGTPALRH